jgi:hypothetical protein
MGLQKHSDEVKAAVLAALACGTHPAELEQVYKVPAATIRKWKSDQKNAPVAIVATTRREEVGDLLVDFLKKAVRTLSVQVEHFGNTTWLEKQTAAEAADLFGTVSDRTFRLLEALEAGAPTEQPPDQPPDGAGDTGRPD